MAISRHHPRAATRRPLACHNQCLVSIPNYQSDFRSRLQAGEVMLGTVLPAPSPSVAGIILGTGVDFLWIDTEHQPFGTEALGTIPAIARLRQVAPVIRVAGNDSSLIKKAYDVGAVAVMVPQIQSAEEAAAAVRHAKYPPQGERGVSPIWPRYVGADWDETIAIANDETALVLQLESRRAFENLDQIKQTPGVDVLMVGPMDLSTSLGRPGDKKSDEIMTLMRELPQRLEGTGIAAGTTLVEVEDMEQHLEWGYRFINVGSVVGYGSGVLRQHLSRLRK